MGSTKSRIKTALSTFVVSLALFIVAEKLTIDYVRRQDRKQLDELTERYEDRIELLKKQSDVTVKNVRCAFGDLVEKYNELQEINQKLVALLAKSRGLTNGVFELKTPTGTNGKQKTTYHEWVPEVSGSVTGKMVCVEIDKTTFIKKSKFDYDKSCACWSGKACSNKNCDYLKRRD